MTHQPVPTPGAPGELVAVTGEALGSVFRIESEPVVIGRGSEAGVRIDASDVSREHARLRRLESGEVELSDLGSSNGTLLNGAPCTRSLLRSGDRIQVGRGHQFEFRYREADERDTLDLGEEPAQQSVDENLARAARNLGRMHMAEGEWRSAIRALRVARSHFRLEPNLDALELASVTSEIAECQLELGRVEESAATAQGLLDELGDTSFPVVRAATLFVLARAVTADDKARGAALAAQALTQLHRDNPLVQRIDAWLSQ